jgi:hypothetical protein
MKRIAIDLEELGEKAGKAAWLDTPAERLRALTTVFQECGERANVYHDPRFVVRVLVKEVVRDFGTERMEMNWDREFHGV